MNVYFGTSVFRGIAVGKISVYTHNDISVRKIIIDDSEAEMQRFNAAKENAIQQLDVLYHMALEEVGDDNAAIFQIHMMMLDDYSYMDSIEKYIRNSHFNAEYAVYATGHSFYDMFLSMEDSYMQARSADIKDITERLLMILYGNSEQKIGADEPAIIIAEDLSPSETVRLSHSNVIAFATASGSVSSHTAILARTMKIPALVGTGIDVLPEYNGKLAVVDGYSGCIYIDPDEKLVDDLILKHKDEKLKSSRFLEYKGRRNVTLDGHEIKVNANTGSRNAVDDAVDNDAGGIGLFRSEYIYLSKNRFPTEDELFDEYKYAVMEMAGKEVVIRTLDVGADKRMDYYGLPEEENPALGWRGIRYLLSRPDIFKTQLRAIYRAAAFGKVSVLYPMVSTIIDIGRIRKVAKEVRDELDADKVPYGKIKRGVLVETPSAVMISDLLAREVDFLSIGTNDLAQYTMVIDRENTLMNDFFDPLNISLFRMIKLVIDNAHKYNKPVGISGEMGADTSLTQIFLAMGVDELSVTPSEILPLRKVICSTSVEKIKGEILQQLWN